MKMTTKKGARIETTEVGAIHVNGKAVAHVGTVIFVGDMGDEQYERENRSWKLARRPGDLPRRCAMFGSPILVLTDDDIVAALKVEAEAWKKQEAEKEAKRVAELEAKKAAVRAACPADCEPCTLGRWFDGMQDYVAADGTVVHGLDGMDAHGCGIVYIEKAAVEEARKEQAKRKAEEGVREAEMAKKRAEAEAKREAAFAEAKATGKKVAIRKWLTTECMNGNDRDCSFDEAVEWAMPDGTTKTTYTCCY